jgi:hypothetical protein
VLTKHRTRAPAEEVEAGTSAGPPMWLPLAVVAAAYLIVQLIAVGVHRAPSWDESIYLSQVMSGVHALPFAPSRARGIVLLVYPIALWTSNIGLIRLAMMSVSSAGLLFAFRVWVPVIGSKASAIAAALFGFSWIALLYGSAVMPNLIAALLGVAATGYVARSVGERCQPHDRLKAGIAVALMALVRPPDAAVLAAIAAAYIFWTKGRRSRWGPVAPIAGLIAGSLPWSIEMSVRFGGPFSAIRAASGVSHVSVSGVASRLTQYLSLADGPTLGPVRTTGVSPVAALWLAGFASLIALGVFKRNPRASLLPAMAGLGLALEYLILISGLAPRFLLPAFGQLSVLAGAGVVGIVRASRGRARTIAVVVAVLGCALTSWHVAVADRIGSEIARAEAQPREVGASIKTAAGRSRCSVISTSSYPEIGLASGCDAREATSPGGVAWIVQMARQGAASFVVTRGSALTTPRGFSSLSIPAPRGWAIHLLMRVPPSAR